MSAQDSKGFTAEERVSPSSLSLGANLVALAGLGLAGYGVVFLVRNFTGLIELGLTPDQVGVTPDQISAFSQGLYNYITHVQAALAGMIIALGLAVVVLAWFGIRRGERWAVWAAFLVPLVALVISLPLHYPYNFDTLGHLGAIYLDLVILLVGTVVANRATNRRPERQ